MADIALGSTTRICEDSARLRLCAAMLRRGASGVAFMDESALWLWEDGTTHVWDDGTEALWQDTGAAQKIITAGDDPILDQTGAPLTAG